MRHLLAIILVLGLAIPVSADEKTTTDKGKDGKTEKPGELVTKKTGRPGELTSEEEDRIDAIVNNFIRYDTGVERKEKYKSDFDDLGVEGIPGLVRGLNRSATMSHSCPVSMIAKKLKRLMRETDDHRTLAFIRENVGAGIGRTPYQGILNDLKVAATLRKAEVDRERREAQLKQSRGSRGSPGERGPGEGKPE